MSRLFRRCPALAICLMAIVLFVSAGAAQDKPAPEKPTSEKPAAVPAKEPAGAQPADPKPADAAKTPKDKEEPGAKEKPAAPNAKPKAQPNIIQNVLRGIFGGPAGGVRPPGPGPAQKPDSKADPDEGGSTRDRLDARAASDVELNRRVAQLRNLIRAGRWDDAMDLVEFLLDGKEDHLYRTPGGAWVSLLGEVEGIVLAMPDEGLRSYRNRFDGPARAARDSARESGDFAQLVSVASRYFPSDAGMLAANDIATVLEDQGEFAGAAHWMRRLLSAKAPLTTDNAWRVAAARRFLFAGDRPAAEAILRGINDLSPFLQVSAPKPAVSDGAGGISAKTWLDSLEPQVRAGSKFASETRMPYGDPAHGGAFRADAPLLFPRWERTLIRRYAVEEQLNSLLLDLVENKKAALPALFPIATAGKVAVRTLFGVAVYDAETGAESWRIENDMAPERLVAGEPVRRTQGRMGVQGFISQPYDGNNPEQHPLASVIFRDGVYGSISSDGQRLFVLEDLAVMPQNIYGYWQQEDVVDPLGRDWKTNSLVAYDLQTGRRLWRIGGRVVEDVFAPPLSGTFFFGAPVPDRDELFVIGERDDSMHLFCLRAATGELLWSQQISGVGQSISRDMVRRGWPCWPAVGDGVVVCPTAAGWLVAVDRVQHRFLWTFRFMARSNSQNLRGGYFINQSLDLHARWYPSAPVISGGMVLATPPELPDETGVQQPMLFALDVQTGKPRWNAQPKSDSLVLAGAVDGRAYLMGSRSVKCVNLKDGTPAWETRWPDLEDLPSGRGLLTEKTYLQPMRSGSLLEIDRTTGAVIRTQKLRQGDAPAGNLAAMGGRIYSVTPQQIVAWEPDQPLESFVKEAGSNLAAALRLSELYLRLQRPADSVAVSRKIPAAEGLSPDQRKQRHDVLWEGLWQLATADPKSDAALVRELEEVAATEADRWALQRLKADRAIARGEVREAWRAYLELIRFRGDELIVEGPLSVHPDAWLAGRLADAYRRLNEGDRAAADGEVGAALGESGSIDDRRRLAGIFGFHAAADAFKLKLVADLAHQGRKTEAALLCRQLAKSDLKETAAGATLLLARLYADEEWLSDARRDLERIVAQYPDAKLGGTLVADAARQELQSMTAPAPMVTPRWPGPYEVVRVFREHAQAARASSPSGDRPAFLDDKHLQVNLQTQRLSLVSTENEDLWSVPLRSSPAEIYNNDSPIVVEGPLTYVVYNGVLHAFSLLEKKPLWTHLPDLRSGSRNLYRQPQIVQTTAMLKASAYVQPQTLARTRPATGMLGAVSDHVVLVSERRSIFALDPLTGKVLWERRGMKPNSRVSLDGERLYLHVANDPPILLDAVSGQVRKQFSPGSAFDKARRIVPGGILTCELVDAAADAGGGGGSGGGKKFRIAKMTHPDPETGKGRPVWLCDAAADALASPLGDDEFLIIEPDGRCRLLDLVSGEVRELANMIEPFGGADQVRRRSSPVYCLADRERVYLLIDQKQIFPNTYLQVPNIRCAGICVALSRSEPKILWQEDVAGLTLATERFADLPILPFLAVQNVNKNDIHYQDIKIRLLDKVTGKPLLSWEGKSYSSHIHAILFDFPRRSLEFRSYNETFQVRPALGAAAASPTAASAAPPASPEANAGSKSK